jgi:outer membrane protein insertion porin family
MRKVCRLLAFVLRVVLLLAVVGPPAARAQYQKFEGKPVRNIQFSPTVQPLEPDELFEILPLKRGQPLRVDDVRASIEHLFATGRYTDIQVDAEAYQDGVIVRFVTTNSWFIGSVTVDGAISSPPNVTQLQNASQLNLGEPYTESKIAAAQAGQQRLLEANGLYQPMLKPVLDWETGKDYQQVNIRFNVNSGPRARFTTPVLAGDIKMDPVRILKATKFQRWIIHTWKPMTQTRVRQALDGVRSLYQKDNRLEAKVSLDSMKFDAETNSAIPTLRIDAGPRIEVRTIGAKISNGKLHRYIPIYEEHTVDHDLLAEGARNLQDYLESAGYYEAEVEFKEQAVTNDRATIDYLINTGRQHKLVAVSISGNHYFQTEMLRERMFLRTASFLQFPHGRYSENLVARDEDTIRNLYQTNGFRDVEVTHSSEDDYKGRAGEIAVFIEIKEGPQYFIDSLSVTGIEKLDKTILLSSFSSSQGQPFSEFSVAVDRDAILAKYFEKGFPDATFEWSSKPAANPQRVALSYVIHEGKAQYVRQVIYTGNKVTKARVINRLLELNPGDPLSPTAITDTQRRLYDLGVFARVDAAIQDPDGETDRKYVLYDLEEAKRFSMAFGFGAEIARIGGCGTCLDAPVGGNGFSPRVSVDFTRNNLWGLAHSLSLRTRASTLEQQALLTYTWPRFGGNPNLSFAITGLYDNSRDIRTFSSKREEGNMQISQRLTKATTAFYRYSYRRVSVDEDTLKISQFLIPALSQSVLLGEVSVGIIQDRRDDPLDPHKGYYNTLDMALADHIFGSQRNFTRLLARNASYYQVNKRVVLARSTAFGDIQAFRYSGDPFDAVPLPERFFGGGGTSHRGFGENQAGPRDLQTGFPIGGNAQFFNQVEMRFPLIGENIGGVLFHDMGNTYSTVSNLSFRVKQEDLQDFDFMVHAVGLGLRYRTPIGPVRVDMAYSLNPPRFFGWNGTQQDLINAGVAPCANGNPLCTVRNSGHFQFFFSIGQTF